MLKVLNQVRKKSKKNRPIKMNKNLAIVKVFFNIPIVTFLKFLSLEEESDNEKDNKHIKSGKRKFSKTSFSEKKPDRKRRGRRAGNCELKGLLMMDFGPGKTPFQVKKFL